jgi:hypothetical protein
MKWVNLNERNKDTNDRMVAERNQLKAIMLPEPDESYTGNLIEDQLADHIGPPKTTGKCDNPPVPVPPPRRNR